MFANFGPWQWVAVSWGLVVLSYALYLVYLGRLERRLRKGGQQP